MPEWTPALALEDAHGELPGFTGSSIRLHPVPYISKLKLQCRPDAVQDIAAFERILGFSMPEAPGGMTDIGFTVFWLAPNEWLLASEDLDVALWREKLTELVSDQSHAISDLSDSLAVIEVSGENSEILLAEGCGIDLSVTKFSTGQYASTRFLDSSVIIHRISADPAFRLYIDRSAVQHLWSWLTDGARQFGACPVQ